MSTLHTQTAALVLSALVPLSCNRKPASIDPTLDPLPLAASTAPSERAERKTAPPEHSATPTPASAASAATSGTAAGASPGLFPSCDTRERSWRIRIKPRSRRAQTLAAIKQAVQTQDALCEPNGELELYATSETLERLFGSHIKLRCTSGMGNSADAADLRADITPDGYLPKELAAHAVWVRMENDPKSELFGEAVNCTELFR